MSLKNRVVVILALLAVIGGPLMTLHPLTSHLFDAGQRRIPRELETAGVIALFGVVGASLVPLVSLVRNARAAPRLLLDYRRIKRQSTPAMVSGVSVRVLPMAGVTFATAGFFRPRIYVSQGAVEDLPSEVLRAGLLHEQAHLCSHDVAWRLALSVLEHAFWPLPTVRRSISTLRLECEVAADRAALAAGASPTVLFDAIVAAAGGAQVPTAVGLASMATMERLALLVEAPSARQTHTARPFVLPLAGLSALALVAHVLFWLGMVCF